MRAEDAKRLTIKELEEQADVCFITADQINEDQRHFEKLRLQLEAQYYLTLAARKHDDRVARRDFWMEVAVIVLIGLELILGGYGIKEGRQQGKVLEHMDVSAAATATAMDNVKQSTADSATAMNAASKSLTTLAKDQDKSLHRLEQMDQTLQASLKQTNTMASALQTQLEILQKEQADRLALLARKPKLVLYWGDDLSVDRPNYDFTPIAETDTSATFHFTFRNQGKAEASRVELGISIRARDVSLQISPPLKTPRGPYAEPTLEFDFLRPNAPAAIIMTFTFPKGHEPFYVFFFADADEVEWTPLGQITVHPRKPVNP